MSESRKTWIRETLAMKGFENGALASVFRYYGSEKSPYVSHNVGQVLQKNLLRLASRTEFNDPFECALTVLPDPRPTSEKIHELSSGIAGHSPELSSAEQTLRAISLAEDGRLEEAMRRALNRTVDSIGIACFCESGDDVLMWSHYGDAHRGLAIELNVFNAGGYGLQIMPVRYAAEPPAVSYADRHDAFYAVLQKSESWSYEREWRIAQMGRAGQEVPIPDGIVASVTLGYRASTVLEEMALESIARTGRPIPLWKMSRQSQSYRLQRHLLT